MEVGAVGGLGGGAAASSAAGGVGAPAAAGAAATPGAGGSPAASLPAALKNLSELLHDFSSSEILLALLLSRGSHGHHHRSRDDSDVAIGMLAGFALARQLQGGMGQAAPSPVSGQQGVVSPPAGGMPGGQLNLQA